VQAAEGSRQPQLFPNSRVHRERPRRRAANERRFPSAGTNDAADTKRRRRPVAAACHRQQPASPSASPSIPIVRKQNNGCSAQFPATSGRARRRRESRAPVVPTTLGAPGVRRALRAIVGSVRSADAMTGRGRRRPESAPSATISSVRGPEMTAGREIAVTTTSRRGPTPDRSPGTAGKRRSPPPTWRSRNEADLCRWRGT